MTQREKLMYKVLGNISQANTPLVFKGALITKLILSEYGYNKIDRMTKDIDANWVDAPPSMPLLIDTVNHALGGLQEQFVAVANREYGNKQSAGVSIVEKSTGDEVISMDIDIKPLIGSKDYYFGETNIKGVLANEILSDKISAISGDSVYKHRAKDLIDVYALSHCIEVQTTDIYDICNKAKREIQSFTAFYERKNDVEHAYNKLKMIEGKPAFDVVYFHLDKFLKPFIEKEYVPKVWNSNMAIWSNILDELPMPTI